MREFAVVVLFWLGMLLMGAGVGLMIGAVIKAWRVKLAILIPLLLIPVAVGSTAKPVHEKWAEQLCDVVRRWDPECGARPNKMVIDTVRKVVLAMKPQFRPWKVEACGESGIRVKYDIPRAKLAIIEIFNDGSVDIDWFTDEGWMCNYRIPDHERLCELVNMTKVFLSL